MPLLRRRVSIAVFVLTVLDNALGPGEYGVSWQEVTQWVGYSTREATDGNAAHNQRHIGFSRPSCRIFLQRTRSMRCRGPDRSRNTFETGGRNIPFLPWVVELMLKVLVHNPVYIL